MIQFNANARSSRGEHEKLKDSFKFTPRRINDNIPTPRSAIPYKKVKVDLSKSPLMTRKNSLMNLDLLSTTAKKEKKFDILHYFKIFGESEEMKRVPDVALEDE